MVCSRIELIGKNANGASCLVDPSDAYSLSQYRWHAHIIMGGKYPPYAASRMHGRKVLMHRIIVGASDRDVVDHINGNTLDNRRCNLRICSASENQFNRHRKLSGRSPFICVREGRGGRWWVETRIGVLDKSTRKRVSIGPFKTAADAHIAYVAHRAKHLNYGGIT